MANASDYYIGANDEHGLNPPTAGKRTPVMPYINRSFYENEFNRKAKYYFILACLRCGFRVYDVKPEIGDVSISTRVARVNARGLTLLVTFAYNAFGDGIGFNNVNGYLVFYGADGYRPTMSRLLSFDLSAGLSETITTKNLGVGTLSGGGSFKVGTLYFRFGRGGLYDQFRGSKTYGRPRFPTRGGRGGLYRGVQLSRRPVRQRRRDLSHAQARQPRQLRNYAAIHAQKRGL